MVQQYIPGTPWYENPEEWDTLQLGGKTFPGVATVRIGKGNKWDRKIAKGEHGETQEYNGALAADVDIEIRLRNTAEYDEFKAILPDFEPDKGKKEVKPHDIVHPVAAVRNVQAVCIDRIDGPNIDGQFATFNFACFQHQPPTKKNATGTAKGGNNDACAANLVLYDSLLTKFASAPTEAERFLLDQQIQITYQTLVSLGCGNHAPPAGYPLGPPPDPNLPEPDPIDSFVDEVEDAAEDLNDWIFDEDE